MSSLHRHLFAASALLLAFALGSCGGASDEGTASTRSPVAAQGDRSLSPTVVRSSKRAAASGGQQMHGGGSEEESKSQPEPQEKEGRPSSGSKESRRSEPPRRMAQRLRELVSGGASGTAGSGSQVRVLPAAQAGKVLRALEAHADAKHGTEEGPVEAALGQILEGGRGHP